MLNASLADAGDAKGLKEPDVNSSCVFPFIYKGEHYKSCNLPGFPTGKFGVDGFYGYCATTDNMDVDRRFKPCEYYGKTGPLPMPTIFC